MNKNWKQLRMRPYYLINVGLREQCTMWKGSGMETEESQEEKICALGPCSELGSCMDVDDEYYSESCLQCKTMANLCILWGWRMLLVVCILVPECYIRNYEQTMTMRILFLFIFLVEVTFYHFPFVIFQCSVWSFQVQVFLIHLLCIFAHHFGICSYRRQCFLINNNSNIPWCLTQAIEINCWPFFSYLPSHKCILFQKHVCMGSGTFMKTYYQKSV